MESHCDALLYIAGALKHLSNNNPAAQKEIVTLEGVQALAQVLESICKEASIIVSGESICKEASIIVSGESICKEASIIVSGESRVKV